jgi:ribosomal protein L10
MLSTLRTRSTTRCSISRPTTALVSLPRAPSRSVVSVKPARVYPKKPVPRVFNERKTYLFDQYSRLLDQSHESPVLLLHYNDFKATRLVKLRRDIVAASDRVAASSLKAPLPIDADTQKPTLTVVRTAVLGAALRESKVLDISTGEQISKLVSGGLAVLTLPSFNPPQLNAVLRAMERTVPPKPQETPEEKKKRLDLKNADPAEPGKKKKRVKPDLVPELKLVGALVEGRLFMPPELKNVSQLPTLETLRAQIVGLLSAPATQLAGVLSEASGGKIARTLEGLKKSLEEGETSA